MFLGLDHGLSGPPVLFETMVFGDYGGGEREQYCTWAEAEAGHRRMVAQLRQRVADARVPG